MKEGKSKKLKGLLKNKSRSTKKSIVTPNTTSNVKITELSAPSTLTSQEQYLNDLFVDNVIQATVLEGLMTTKNTSKRRSSNTTNTTTKDLSKITIPISKQKEKSSRRRSKSINGGSTQSKLGEFVTLKICLLGSVGAGKTTLAKRIETNRFNASLEPTVEFDVITVKRIYKNVEYQLVIYDYQGDPFQNNGTNCVYGTLRSVHCLLLVYDSLKINHAKEVSKILDFASSGTFGSPPSILVGTKKDLFSTSSDSLISALKEDKIEMEKLGKLVDQEEKSLFLISSLTGEMVEELLCWTIEKAATFKESYMLARQRNNLFSSDSSSGSRGTTGSGGGGNFSPILLHEKNNYRRLTHQQHKEQNYKQKQELVAYLSRATTNNPVELQNIQQSDESISSSSYEEESEDSWWYWLDCFGCFISERNNNRNEISSPIKEMNEFYDSEIEIQSICW